MRSFWIFCAAPEAFARRPLALVVGLVIGLLLPPTAPAAELRLPEPAEVTNLYLSPQHSRWLVGPISQIATPEEVAAYLELRSDEQAERFIAEFWQRRGPEPLWPEKGTRDIFEERVAEADRLFGEGIAVGHQTHRGTVHVLYGPPKKTRFEISAGREQVPVEVWSYPRKAEPGLDGRRPGRTYSFIEKGDRFVLYHGPLLKSAAPRDD